MSIAKQCQDAQTKPEKSEAFSRLHTEIRKISNSNNLQELSDFIRDFADHTPGMHGVFLVAILRLTCLQRDEIESWHEVRDLIAIEFESRGKNSAQILVGLYDET